MKSGQSALIKPDTHCDCCAWCNTRGAREVKLGDRPRDKVKLHAQCQADYVAWLGGFQ